MIVVKVKIATDTSSAICRVQEQYITEGFVAFINAEAEPA